jgi:hypothetical protein
MPKFSRIQKQDEECLGVWQGVEKRSERALGKKTQFRRSQKTGEKAEFTLGK